MSNLPERITINPNILQGKPTIRGLRISVAHILSALAAGISQDELLIDYPELEPEDFVAALTYAATLVEDTKVFPIPN